MKRIVPIAAVVIVLLIGSTCWAARVRVVVVPGVVYSAPVMVAASPVVYAEPVVTAAPVVMYSPVVAVAPVLVARPAVVRTRVYYPARSVRTVVRTVWP